MTFFITRYVVKVIIKDCETIGADQCRVKHLERIAARETRLVLSYGLIFEIHLLFTFATLTAYYKTG